MRRHFEPSAPLADEAIANEAAAADENSISIQSNMINADWETFHAQAMIDATRGIWVIC